MLICVVYLLICLGVAVFIIANIIDFFAHRDYLMVVCFALFFLVVCTLMAIALFVTIR